jgi:Uma2 family endonuclease
MNSSALTTAKWSIEDYHQIIKAGILDDRQVELLNGEIIEMPPEGETHSSSSTVSRNHLIQKLGERATVREGHPITIPASNSEPEPDLAIVRRDEEDYWEHHPYPADIFWLIEFSDSSLKKDLDSKAKIYAAADIPEYWIVNLKQMEIVVMRNPVNGEYRSQITCSNDTISPLAFPDISIEVAKLLRKRQKQ